MEKLGIECKKLMAKEIKTRLMGTSCLFLTSFNAMAVSEQEQLRRKLKEMNAFLFVVKNRIARQIFQQLKFEPLAALMQGMTALTLGGDDSIAVSKTLVDLTKKNENFKILGAYVDEQLLNLDSVKRLAAIPSKEILFAQIVSGFQSPIQGLMNCLSATVRGLVVVLDKIREKK